MSKYVVADEEKNGLVSWTRLRSKALSGSGHAGESQPSRVASFASGFIPKACQRCALDRGLAQLVRAYACGRNAGVDPETGRPTLRLIGHPDNL